MGCGDIAVSLAAQCISEMMLDVGKMILFMEEKN